MKKAAIHNLNWGSLGGGERYAAAFAKVLEESDYSIDIWWANDLREAIKNRFNIDLLTSKFIPRPHGNRILSTKNYDLIFWVVDGSIPVSMAHKNIIHYQIPFHGSPSNSWTNKFKAKLLPGVSNSQFTKKFVDQTYGINTKVIYPPVATNYFRPGTKENLIVSVARFSKILHAKRQDTLISAFSQISEKLPGWKLVLAGGSQDDEYVNTLKKMADGLPIEFMVNPSLDTLKNLFSQAKIFWSATGYEVDEALHPEKVEHFGITPVEAMAAGVVPVVTDAGGHKETIEPNISGFLWSTIDEMKSQTFGLCGNASLWQQMSQACQNRSKLFSQEIFMEEFRKLI
jgi:glycosyltransferase involved in cell wall biosynthesis